MLNNLLWKVIITSNLWHPLFCPKSVGQHQSYAGIIASRTLLTLVSYRKGPFTPRKPWSWSFCVSGKAFWLSDSLFAICRMRRYNGDVVELIVLIVEYPTISLYSLKSRMSTKYAYIVWLEKEWSFIFWFNRAISLHYQSSASYEHDAEVFVLRPLTQSKRARYMSCSS